jgi:hypothetical protein
MYARIATPKVLKFCQNPLVNFVFFAFASKKNKNTADFSRFHGKIDGCISDRKEASLSDYDGTPA